MKWDIFGDFYMSLRFVDNYDSRPLGEAPNNDYKLRDGARVGVLIPA